jgi:hypothetical protein
MAFLPMNDINKISKATISLLDRYQVIPNYEIISINSKNCKNPKKEIEDAHIRAKNSSKIGVLVLSGKQCSMAVTLKSCDVVLLLNNSMSFDMIYQMMFRCMTDAFMKKCGFVIDLNINRVIETSLLDYSSIVKPDEHPRDAIKYLLREKLIILNGDHWMPCFGHNLMKLTEISEMTYELYASNTEKALKHFLDRLKFKDILLTNEEKSIFNKMFNGKISKDKKLLVSNNNDEMINIGIESTIVMTDQEETTGDKKDNKDNKDNKDKEDNRITYMDVLKHIIPLVCILTIRDEETKFVNMYNSIKQDKYLYNIFISQLQSWWSKNIDGTILKDFINIYIKYMMDDKETNQIILTVKELFKKNTGNRTELSKLIDKYLIPQELEKKTNAEVSTPYKLRQDMLDKIPDNFWTDIHRVFEPCSGKGGFLIDILDRFMIGLKDKIIDDQVRYKTIVEQCLYWSDINPTNIFICKLLLDPENKYKLNYNEGDTLKINIFDKFGFDHFDAVIGNPPYQNNTNNKGSGNTLWNLFVDKCINYWLKPNGYLLYVHPRGWRQLNNKTGILMRSLQIIYLNMNNVKCGLDIFYCSTDFDYYLLENKPVYKKTIINDYHNKQYEILIDNNISFIPNHSINEVYDLIKIDDENNFINDQSSYEPRKKWMNKNKTEEHIYPCIYSINSKNQLSLKWSKINTNGHFGLTKFIFTNGAGYFKDINGDYGLTQWAYALVCNKDELDDIEKAFNSTKFKNIMDAIQLTSNKYNYNVIKLFKRNFYKQFLE